MSLSGGIRVPYPDPTSPAATTVGKANRRRDTKPEVLLRSALHRHGLRFRKDHPLRAGDVRVRADIAFTRMRLAVFVDGCFWHACPLHLNIPKSNRSYWVPKLEANRARDQRVNDSLREHGWLVLRIWEHEPVDAAAARVIEAVRAAASSGSDGRPET